MYWFKNLFNDLKSSANAAAFLSSMRFPILKLKRHLETRSQTKTRATIVATITTKVWEMVVD